MNTCPYTAGDLLFHTPPMILIDDIVGWAPGEFAAAVNISERTRFYVEGKGVPAYVGIEYMAQTCGLYAGFESKQQGRPVRLGFLLGSRNFHTDADWFSPGERLIVTVRETYRQEPMGIFDCTIECDAKRVATARLSVYQPKKDVHKPEDLG
jgi:predicted hotdog family 3-hydroxylacyl-ACP dehydratase